MKPLTLKDPEVKVTVTCEDEDIPVQGNALASGDDATDRECENEILAALAKGGSMGLVLRQGVCLVANLHG